MQNMKSFQNNVRITKSEYLQLCKYRDSYHALCSDIVRFYETDAEGHVIGVYADDLAEQLRPLVQKIVGDKS